MPWHRHQMDRCKVITDIITIIKAMMAMPTMLNPAALV